jgi:hypothetical protein
MPGQPAEAGRKAGSFTTYPYHYSIEGIGMQSIEEKKQLGIQGI